MSMTDEQIEIWEETFHIYSDVHKSYFGFRPRFGYVESREALQELLPVAMMGAEMDSWVKQTEEEMHQEYLAKEFGSEYIGEAIANPVINSEAGALLRSFLGAEYAVPA